MRAYRAYLLDDDGLVIRIKVFEAHRDDEAVQAMTAWAGERQLELWSGSRAIPISRKTLQPTRR